MSHRELRKPALAGNARALQQAFGLLWSSAVLTSVVFRRDCQWTPRGLCAAAMWWGCSGELTLTERGSQALEITATIPPGQAPVQASYQAFVKLLRRWTPVLWEVLRTALRRQIQALFPRLFRLSGLAVFAIDGSRIDLPRTKSHAAVYSPAKSRNLPKKPKKHAKTRQAKVKAKGVRRARRRSTAAARERQGSKPLMWITTLWHVTTGLA